ncbi:MAG TPA: Mur ligase domain-containing protein, partial [Chitinophagaceae bacterium]
MDLNKVKRVYFIGIGGIGMSALARYFHERKVTVSGYDRNASVLTRELEAEGMQVHYEEGMAFMDKAADLVVYTPAIPKDNAVLNYYREAGYTVMKRSDMLQEITKGLFCITVAGTHGKTTISTLIAHILRHSGYGCSAFLGGISVNYNTNFWSSENKVAVIEADEYDRSFLKLKPDIAVLTAMDPDHLDIYGTREEMQKAFIGYTRNIAPEGVLIVKSGLPADNELQARH